MNSSDETQDRELLERYRQASSAEALAPRDAVRAAILEEGRRAAAGFSTPAARESERRPSRWKMTAFATAATVLLAALVIAPKLLEHERHRAADDARANSFKQAAVHKAQIEALPATPPVPVIPVEPAPLPKMEDLMPSPNIPNRQRSVEAPPIHYPEQSVEISMLKKNQSMNQNRSTAGAPALSSNLAYQRSAESGELLAAAASGDAAKATSVLDQHAAMIDERDSAGRTPLMLAVEQGQLDLVRILLGRGADPNAADQAGLTPLKRAEQKGFADIASALKQAGAR